MDFVGGSPVPEGYVRIRRDRRHPRRAGRAGEMRDRRSARAGNRRDRHRRLSRHRSGQLRDGRSVRRVHRLCRRRPLAEAAIRVTCITHRTDPILRGTIEGSMPGSFSENAVCSSIMRAATALERASTAPACRASPTCGARRSRPAPTFLCRSSKVIATRPSRSPTHCGALPPRMCATSTSPWSDDDIDIPRLRGDRLGDRAIASMPARTTSSSCRRPSARARSVDAAARPQCHAIRHRQVGPRADRRHHQSRLRPRSRSRRRALPADGMAGRPTTSPPPGALERIRAR